jgi:hypothetical protein
VYKKSPGGVTGELNQGMENTFTSILLLAKLLWGREPPGQSVDCLTAAV